MSCDYDPVALEDIERFDREFKPDGGIAPGPDSLPDGEYDFAVVGVKLEKSKNSGTPILRLMLRVVGGARDGQTLERPSFLDKQKGVDRLGADLVTLGFDAETWTQAHGKRFSQELAVAMPKLPGIIFSAKKVTSDEVDKNGKPYHNIYINSLVRLADMPQRPALPARTAASAPTQPVTPRPSWQPPPANGLFAPGPAAQQTQHDDEDIPF